MMAQQHYTGLLCECLQTLKSRRYRLHRKKLRALDSRNCKLFRLPHINPNQPLPRGEARLNLLRTEFYWYWHAQHTTFTRPKSKKAWENY